MTLWSKFKVIGHYPWNQTCHLYVIYPHAKYQKLTSIDKKKLQFRDKFVTEKQEFDLKVKVQGQRPLFMVRDTSSLSDLPTYKI